MLHLNQQLEEHSKTEEQTSGGNLYDTEIQSSTPRHENAFESNEYEIDSQVEDQSIEEDSTSETRNEQPMQLVPYLKQKAFPFSFL
jgi:hypothetical protein